MNETDKIVDINSYEKQENYEETDEMSKFIISIFIYGLIAIFQILGLFVSKLFIILCLILLIVAILICVYFFIKILKNK